MLKNKLSISTMLLSLMIFLGCEQQLQDENIQLTPEISIETNDFLRGTSSIKLNISGASIDQVDLLSNNQNLTYEVSESTEGDSYTFTFDSKQLKEGRQMIKANISYVSNDENEITETSKEFEVNVDNYLPTCQFENGYEQALDYNRTAIGGIFETTYIRSNSKIDMAFYDEDWNRISETFSSNYSDTIKILIPESNTSQKFYATYFISYDYMRTRKDTNTGEEIPGLSSESIYIENQAIHSSDTTYSFFKKNQFQVKQVTVGFNIKEITAYTEDYYSRVTQTDIVTNIVGDYKYITFWVNDSQSEEKKFASTFDLYNHETNKGATVLASLMNHGDTFMIKTSDLEIPLNKNSYNYNLHYYQTISSENLNYYHDYKRIGSDSIGFYKILNLPEGVHLEYTKEKTEFDADEISYSRITSKVENLTDYGKEIYNLSLIQSEVSLEKTSMTNSNVVDGKTEMQIYYYFYKPADTKNYNYYIRTNGKKDDTEISYSLKKDPEVLALHGNKIEKLFNTDVAYIGTNNTHEDHFTSDGYFKLLKWHTINSGQRSILLPLERPHFDDKVEHEFPIEYHLVK
ncbi:hypothetical protein KMW28_05475 [Flammeovirga yaeyamensis]|uniref:Lipoprotein n=1 Tax=Flammeovirga yaeyamensis TaxID=367791 RepID=A0AAX1N733_9BACT|nr:hypothetical protein [Flammeovirga yaeyamensis]MBB3697615.1 hypothetical protein [Flammeovirga yaeyamensis]NMF36305.1 hypothetical protein [Flammeovirga yaeyamensis]QWG03032.1 hypothetical protein KMW28_05475 [Flammeovirga yaeyamensis]